MATFTPGPLAASISGPIGSITFSHHRGQAVIRSRRTHHPTVTELARLRRTQVAHLQHSWHLLLPEVRLRYQRVAEQISRPTGPGFTQRLTALQLGLQIYISHVVQARLAFPSNPSHLVAPQLFSFSPQFTADTQADVVCASHEPTGNPGALIDGRRLYRRSAPNARPTFRFLRYIHANAPPTSILDEVRSRIAPCRTGDTIVLRYRAFLFGRRPSKPQTFTLTVL